MRKQRGQTLVEIILYIALIVVISSSLLPLIGQKISSGINSAKGNIENTANKAKETPDVDVIEPKFNYKSAGE